MDKSANKRIGILGGTFNPIHNGHLHLARGALKKIRLNRVIFVPAHIPPHKKIQGRVKTSDRLRMLRLAVDSEKRFTVSLYEIKKLGKSYSIKTAKFFRKKYGKAAELFFLIGADSLRGLKNWKDIKTLRKLVQFAVLARPGFKIKKDVLEWVLKINIPKKDISSTKIRRLAARKKSIRRFVPDAVSRYIKKKGLYRT